MSKEQATLVAAIIAAVASLLVLVANLLGARRAEMRAAHRTALVKYLETVGEGIHETAASATIIRRLHLQSAETKTWRDNGKSGSDKLKLVRPKIKYTLYGLDEPLRTLSRMPEWIATYKSVKQTNADELLEEMQKLAGAIDGAVRWSYKRGLPPGPLRRWWLKRRTKRVRKLWGARFDEAEPRPDQTLAAE
jgi:hypothetical protein